MKKKTRSSEYQHRMADSFASAALDAKIKGETGRAIILYEHALNFELEAINSWNDGSITSIPVWDLYQNAISYSVECGRGNKARHLIEAALAQNPPQDLAAEFENLRSRK